MDIFPPWIFRLTRGAVVFYDQNMMAHVELGPGDRAPRELMGHGNVVLVAHKQSRAEDTDVQKSSFRALAFARGR